MSSLLYRNTLYNLRRLRSYQASRQASVFLYSERLHGVKLSAYARLTFVFQQLFPLTTLFLPLLDRLCSSFVAITSLTVLPLSCSQLHIIVKPRSHSWVGFHLLILLSVVLVFGIPYGF
jgi:hypothetical protein